MLPLPQSKPVLTTEETLLQQYQATKDQQYLGQLFNRYLHLVYGLCLKYLKNREASQDAVMDIYEHIGKKLLETNVMHFKSWLYMVSKNHCLMILRKKNPEESNEIIMESPDAAHLQEEKEELENDLDSLEKCIEELKEEQKECVKRFFLKRNSYHEISAHTGIALKKVKSHIQNGKRNLRICLEDKNVSR